MQQENYRTLTLNISDEHDKKLIKDISRALSNEDRIQILELLNNGPLNILEISQKLNIPLSTTANHIQILDEARLIMTEFTPTLKGHMKLCSRMVTKIDYIIWNSDSTQKTTKTTKIEMPVGNFVDANVYSPCGMAGDYSHLIEEDQPSLFYSPKRSQAGLIWFQKGYITYRFPLGKINKKTIKELSIELELCSETAYYKEEWPSDITISLCNEELFTYTSPGDFGINRGQLNPIWWPNSNTQHGLLKKFTIVNNGVYFEGKRVNDTFTLEKFHNLNTSYIELKLEIKSDAKHIGGINIFGKTFGNHPQDILLSITHED